MNVNQTRLTVIRALLINNLMTVLFVMVVVGATLFWVQFVPEIKNPLLPVVVLALFGASSIFLLFLLVRGQVETDLLKRDMSHVLMLGLAVSSAAACYNAFHSNVAAVLVFLALLAAWLAPRKANYKVSVRNIYLSKKEVVEFLLDAGPFLVVMVAFCAYITWPAAVIIGAVIYGAICLAPREYDGNGRNRFI